MPVAVAKHLQPGDAETFKPLNFNLARRPDTPGRENFEPNARAQEREAVCQSCIQKASDLLTQHPKSLCFFWSYSCRIDSRIIGSFCCFGASPETLSPCRTLAGPLVILPYSRSAV